MLAKPLPALALCREDADGLMALLPMLFLFAGDASAGGDDGPLASSSPGGMARGGSGSLTYSAHLRPDF